MKGPDFTRERALLSQGFSLVAGIDEVGRGAWAGPVVAGAVIFPPELTRDPLLDWIPKIRDSKTLSKTQREKLSQLIKNHTTWAIGECTNQEIDAIGIGDATRQAMERAINKLSRTPDYLLFDGHEYTKNGIAQQSIIDGDALSTTIAAASIIAKVYRDGLMEKYDQEYPGYGLSSNVGYGTKQHIEALGKLGVNQIHRLSYKPIQKFQS